MAPTVKKKIPSPCHWQRRRSGHGQKSVFLSPSPLYTPPPPFCAIGKSLLLKDHSRTQGSRGIDYRPAPPRSAKTYIHDGPSSNHFFCAKRCITYPPPLLPPPREEGVGLPTAQTPLLLSWGSQKVRTRRRRRRLRTHFSGCRRRGVAFGGGSSKQFLLSFSAFLAKFVCVCAEMFMTGGNCQKSPEGRILGGEKGWGAAADGLSSPFLLNYRAEGWRLPLIKFPPPVPSLERAATRPSLSRKIDLGGKRTKGEEEEFHGHRRFRSFPQLGRPEKGELNTCMSLPTLA